VVVGIGGPDGGALKQQALRAIGARPTPAAPDRLQAPPTFEEVVAYDPLVGNVSQGKVVQRLKAVKRNIQAAMAGRQDVVLSEVVLLYYHGREVVTRDGLFLLTDYSVGDEDLTRTGVGCEQIVQLFSDARGAHVVMLDVEQARAEADGVAAAGAFQGTRLGVFHALWSAGGGAPANRLLALLQ
jgi:hypothetical protein